MAQHAWNRPIFTNCDCMLGLWSKCNQSMYASIVTVAVVLEKNSVIVGMKSKMIVDKACLKKPTPYLSSPGHDLPQYTLLAKNEKDGSCEEGIHGESSQWRQLDVIIDDLNPHSQIYVKPLWIVTCTIRCKNHLIYLQSNLLNPNYEFKWVGKI